MRALVIIAVWALLSSIVDHLIPLNKPSKKGHLPDCLKRH